MSNADGARSKNNTNAFFIIWFSLRSLLAFLPIIKCHEGRNKRGEAQITFVNEEARHCFAGWTSLQAA